MLTFPTVPASFPAPAVLPHQDLLASPAPAGFGTRIQERWRQGLPAQRRIAALRALPGGRYVEERAHGGEVVVDYPATLKAPPIEARMAKTTIKVGQLVTVRRGSGYAIGEVKRFTAGGSQVHVVFTRPDDSAVVLAYRLNEILGRDRGVAS